LNNEVAFIKNIVELSTPYMVHAQYWVYPVSRLVQWVLLASGIGFVPGLALEAVTGVAGLQDAAGVVVSRRCSRKVAKHEAVRILASSKLNTVHSHISKALEDCKISDDEYKLVLDEVEKYRAMKEELRRKHTAGSLID